MIQYGDNLFADIDTFLARGGDPEPAAPEHVESAEVESIETACYCPHCYKPLTLVLVTDQDTA